MENITVTDDLSGDIWTITLAPAESQILQTSHSITAADISNGSVENTATAEVDGISVSASETVVYEGAPPPVPISSWALILTIGLILIFMVTFYRRLT
ncbi:MAG: hypothetical protein U5Q03_15285 [Bacteroidota bacterium]|nr:hypothetical protein [Bacteroidota bacterium]